MASCLTKLVPAAAQRTFFHQKLDEDGCAKAGITRDEKGRVVSVESGGYRTAWENAVFVRVENMGNGNHMHASAGKTEVYFDFGKLQVCAEISDGKVVMASRREPPAAFNDYWVIPGMMKKAALKVQAELKEVLAEAEKIRKEAATAQA